MTIVYFTEGYPSFVSEPNDFVQEALRVNAPVYAIDARGFIETARQFDAKDWEAYIAATQASVRTVASQTGAVVFTRTEFDALLSSLAKVAPLNQ